MNKVWYVNDVILQFVYFSSLGHEFGIRWCVQPTQSQVAPQSVIKPKNESV